MASDIGFYTPLRTIIAYTMDEEQKSVGDEDRLWILGLRGLTEMNFDVSGHPKTVRLPVLGNKTVLFPADCLSWSKIGNLNENGEIVALKINNALTTYRDLNPNRLDQLTADVNTGDSTLFNSPFFNNFYLGGYCYNIGFNSGRGGMVTYGECRVDEGNRVIVLAPDFAYDSIMFEYVSSPQKDNDYQVQTCLQEAIIMFIRWKLKLASAQDFYGEVTKARRRLTNKKVVLQSLNDVFRRNGFYVRY